MPKNTNALTITALKLLSLILVTSHGLGAQSPATKSAKQSTSADPGVLKAPAANSAAKLPREKSESVRLPHFEKAPVIDGRLDDEVWQHAVVLKDFYQVQPGDNIPPSEPTEVLLGYDEKFLYLGFRAFDDPAKVRATLAKRDQVFDDDNVSVYLDTYNDKRKAYELIFNPLGVQADAIFTEGTGEDFTVDIVMESKGTITKDGYTVEVAIPFKSLRYESGKDRLWGAHFFRRIKRLNNELDSWMPISRDISAQLSQAGHLTGLEGISGGRTLEIIPSLTLSETGKRVRSIPVSSLQNDPSLLDPGRFVNRPIKSDLGLTAKLGITPTVTLDLAINPDFAQVEADQTVVTANQRFPIFYPEKRPFFLEGIDIFNTPLNAVNTRTIIDPDIAVKLTGKLGRNTFGLMLASDNAPGNFSEEERADPSILPQIQRFLDKNAYIGVLRLKHDVGTQSNIGLIVTTYNFIEKHNNVGGFDGRFQVNQQTYFSFQVLGTTAREVFFDADAGTNIFRTGNGLGYSFNYESSGRHFGYRFSGLGRTRDYRAEVGFTSRTNTNQEDLFVRYDSEPKPKARLIAWHVYNSFRPRFDWQGRTQNWTNETQVSFSLQRQTNFGIGLTPGYERLFEEEFGPKRTPTRAGTFAGNDPERSTGRKGIYGFLSTTPSKQYSMFIFAGYTLGAFDFDFGAGPKFPRVSPGAILDPNARLDPGAGKSLDISATFTYQPTNKLRASLDYTKSRLVRNDTERVAFDENIYSLNATYQFTRFTFARARLDYDTLAANVRGQFLLGWTPNPGTAFYAGYNNDLNRNGFSPFTGQFESGFRRNGQTFFIKMSYLFRRNL
jgi:hypothetical protein